jgi:cation diffusion facilitator family transporter
LSRAAKRCYSASVDGLAGAGRRIALASIAVSAALAALKISVGIRANSTAVVSDGFESASDVLSSSIVLIGLVVAARPPDEDHPYGHGRFEILTALFVGAILFATGALVCYHSVQRALDVTHAPEFFAVWPLLISIVCKSVLWSLKRAYGRRMRSEALLADSSNDAVDVLSAAVALTGLSITLFDPKRFVAFDHIGGFGVGIVVIILGVRIMRDTVLQLMDTMPDEAMLDQIRGVALQVPGALGIEKCRARKTGMKYHVDLHLEVDPNLTVQASHEIATQVRIVIKESLDWVADVLVHVEPHGLDTARTGVGSASRMPPR